MLGEAEEWRGVERNSLSWEFKVKGDVGAESTGQLWSFCFSFLFTDYFYNIGWNRHIHTNTHTHTHRHTRMFRRRRRQTTEQCCNGVRIWKTESRAWDRVGEARKGMRYTWRQLKPGRGKVVSSCRITASSPHGLFFTVIVGFGIVCAWGRDWSREEQIERGKRLGSLPKATLA